MLDGRPAVMVTGVEMSPRAPAETGSSRSHGSAWEALDSLAESVLTTDVDGRIVYINSSGEQLIGKPASEILGRTLGDVIELVDEGDRKAASDPVRQSLTTGARVSSRPPRHARLGRKRRRAFDRIDGVAHARRQWPRRRRRHRAA